MKKLVYDLLIPACLIFVLIATTVRGLETDTLQPIPVFNIENKHNNITLVIDAGHGGADGGAISISGDKESVINLRIAEKIELLSAFFGINTVMTRTSEAIDYPAEAVTIREKKIYDQNSRIELINCLDNQVLISVHQNKYSSSDVSGLQIFYKNDEISKFLGEKIQNSFISGFSKLKVRESNAISDDIFLFNNITCPGILIECGFLSNPNDNALLSTEIYKTKIAMLITCGYLDFEDELINQYSGGTNENENSVLLY